MKFFQYTDEAPGADDNYLILKAFAEGSILITNDQDFGEKIYRERHSDRGAVFMRLRDEGPTSKIRVTKGLLDEYSD